MKSRHSREQSPRAKAKPDRNEAKKPSVGQGQVRIISGMWRGRKLPVASAPGLRPTTDRVKETVFNWLSAWVPASTCLDCFSGSGSLGFEALSRGAAHCTMIENNNAIATQLKQNLVTVQAEAEQAQVINADCLSYLAQAAQRQYDLVFLDPPFGKDMLTQCFELLEGNAWLAERALIYVEAERSLGELEVPANWTQLKEKKAGALRFRLYERSA